MVVRWRRYGIRRGIRHSETVQDWYTECQVGFANENQIGRNSNMVTAKNGCGENGKEARRNMDGVCRERKTHYEIVLVSSVATA